MSATNLSAVALSFLFSLVRCPIGLLGVHRLGGLEKDVEIIVLRQHLQVLHRRTPPPRFTWADRALLALAAELRQLSAVVVVRDTSDGALLATQDRPKALDLSPPRPGRPSLPVSHVELICRLAPRESPLGLPCASSEN